ncbi:MAG TPA: methyltransferase domain-containing protein [Candidatus Angelobacter sp.]|nr:methyltransferase domain-containing protein [Candidatus Angelobacter sp.]
MTDHRSGVRFRSCAGCGEADAQILHVQRFVVPEAYPLPGEYAVVRCNRCGFVYADTPAPQEQYDQFYRDWSKYDDAATSTGSGLNEYDAERLRTTAADLAEALPLRNMRVLDAGCASGGLLRALRDLGLNAAGLDPSARCADLCKEHGFAAYTGTITAPPREMPQFDCLVASHVLEHVCDIPAFFRALRKLIKTGGYLYLETPDAARYADYLYAPFQEFNTEHINHFSGISLTNVVCRFGFELVVVRSKLLQTSEKHFYPAVFGIFRLLPEPGNSCNGGRDETLLADVARYIEQSQAMMHEIGKSLEQQLEDEPAVSLWGAGQLAMKLLDLPALRERKVVAVLDSNPVLHGKRLAGAPVMPPEAGVGRNEPIVISTLLHEEQIASRICQLMPGSRIVRLLPGGASMETRAS